MPDLVRIYVILQFKIYHYLYFVNKNRYASSWFKTTFIGNIVKLVDCEGTQFHFTFTSFKFKVSWIFKQKYFPHNNGARICVGLNIFQQSIDMLQHNLYYTYKCIQQLVIDLHLFFDSAFNFFYQILQVQEGKQARVM